MPHPTREMMYFGDDFGGHNIPFPHPAPPKPHKMYDQNAFVDLSILHPPSPAPKHPDPYSHNAHSKIPTQFLAGEKDGLQAGLAAGYKDGVKDAIQRGSVGGIERQQTPGYAKPKPAPAAPTPPTTNQGYGGNQGFGGFGGYDGYDGYDAYGGFGQAQHDPYNDPYGDFNGFNKAGPIDYGQAPQSASGGFDWNSN